MTRRMKRSISKATTKELEADNWLLLSLGVAKELGYTLQRLWAETTQEEIILWSVYFGYLNDQQERAMRDAKRKGRR